MGKRQQKLKKLVTLAVLTVFLSFSLMNVALASSITAQAVIELVNQARMENGLKALEENAKLSAAAKDKSEDMVGNNYFAHNSPKGITPWFWMEKNNYDYTYAGENLAMDFNTVEKEQDAWMKSESHRKNILNPNYQEIGVAVKQGMINGKLTTIAVQEFGARKDFVASKNPPILPAKGRETAKVLGEEENNPSLQINLTPKPNASFAESFDLQMTKISDGAVKSFQYAKATFNSPSFLDSIDLGAYSILIAIILIANPLIMFYLLGLVIARKIVSVPVIHKHQEVEI